MEEQSLTIDQILEWYLCAGVDETCGEKPFAAPPVVDSVPVPVIGLSVRQATSGLAQAVNTACQSAREICSKINTLEELRTAVENFEGCALKMTAAHTVFGDGNSQAKVLFIGEAPGADEDRIGVPFVGRSGHLLDKMMAAVGLSRKDVYICNILPWRPPGNRTPLDSEVAVCLPFLRRQIDLVDPDYIFILGASAANSVLNTAETISKMRGKWFEYQKTNGKKAFVLASFHPAYLLRTPGQKAKAWSDLLRLRQRLNDENG